MTSRDSVDVLVCEDNEINQLVFKNLLEASGISYAIAGDGELGIELYNTLHPRLVLMDISMPRLNGLDTTRHIREIEDRVGIHTPIIGVTAHAMPADMEACIDAGMDEYVPKPISPMSLLDKINAWLEKSIEDERQSA